MPRISRLEGVLLGAFIVLGSATMSSCLADILAPCKYISSSDPERPTLDFMDGPWSLSTINSAAFTGNFQIPQDTSRLNLAQMDFHTLRLDRGNCNDPVSSSGEVIAYYGVTNKAGVRTDKSVVGSFKFTNKTGKVVISAFGYNEAGVAFLTTNGLPPGTGLVDQSIMDISTKIPLGLKNFDLSLTTFNLRFKRFK